MATKITRLAFGDLEFTHEGCCGTHRWAVMQHPSGIRSEVYEKGEGWAVVAFRGGTLEHGEVACATEADVLARLAADAMI